VIYQTLNFVIKCSKAIKSVIFVEKKPFHCLEIFASLLARNEVIINDIISKIYGIILSLRVNQIDFLIIYILNLSANISFAKMCYLSKKRPNIKTLNRNLNTVLQLSYFSIILSQKYK